MKSYSFDLSKVDQIFDMLFKAKQIKLVGKHKVPNHEELCRKSYCKWNNSFTHLTNKCIMFCNVIQKRINKKLFHFPNKTEAMEVNTNPFPKLVHVDMITVNWASNNKESNVNTHI